MWHDKTKKFLDKAFLRLVDYYNCSTDAILVLLGRIIDIRYADFCSDSLTYAKAVGNKIARYFSKMSINELNSLIKNYEIDGYDKILIENWMDWQHVKDLYDISFFGNTDTNKAVLWIKQ